MTETVWMMPPHGQGEPREVEATPAQLVPLMITAAGAIFLGEKVGWRRWAAILVGFIGVMIVIRPGLEGFNFYAVMALASMLFITLRDMNSRMMPRAIPPLLIAIVTGFFVGLSGPGIGLFLGETWVVPSWHAIGLIAVAILFLVGVPIAAVWALVRALREDGADDLRKVDVRVRRRTWQRFLD